jgi:LCP family protein required for cell wall assembly
MSEYPDNWFRGGGAGNSPGVPGAAGAWGDAAIPPGGAHPAGAGGGEPTVQAPSPAYAPTAAGWPGGQPGGGAGSGSAWPDQPPVNGSPAFGGGSRWSGWRQRWLRPRWILAVVAAVVALILVATVGMYFNLNSKVTRIDALASPVGAPVSAGQNWLITGSNGNLTPQLEHQFHTGQELDQLSDTIMLLHVPANGQRPTLVSIPRDSYVTIPGHGLNKINAAFAFGGAKLMVQTVQSVTGLHVNHYLGVGYQGLSNVVNALGGVTVCLPGPFFDWHVALHLRRGCHTLNGSQSIGFLRSRAFGVGDLQRVQDQRLFLQALVHKLASPGTLLNPFTAIPAASDSAGALTADKGTSLYQLMQAGLSMRAAQTTTVPFGGFQTTSVGSVVLWDQATAKQLFSDLATDKPLPKNLITGSKLAPTA